MNNDGAGWLCGGSGEVVVLPELSETITSVFFVTGATFAAIVVWLTIRIINRRETWAIRTALGLFVVAMYPVSFGPVCWITSRANVGAWAIPMIYRPMVSAMRESNRIYVALDSYARLGSPSSWQWSTWSDGNWGVPEDSPP
jgi:hypothetical protein